MTVNDPRFESIIALIRRLASGDLRARLDVEGHDDVSAVMDGLNMLGEELERSVRAHKTMSALVDASTDCIATLEEDGRLTFVNKAGMKMAGLSVLEPDTTLQSCFDRLGRKAIGSEALAAVRAGNIWKGQLTMNTDSPVEVDVSLFPLGLENGSVSAAVARDISGLVRANQDLHRLGTAVEHSEAPIFVTAPSGRIEYVNPAFERVTGFSREDALGQNAKILSSGHHGPEFYKEFWATLSCKQVWSGRFINRKKSGELYEEHTTVLPVLDNRGKISNYIAVRRDVSREVRLEAQLRQAQKMEAVGRLAGGIAHEFNNLLAVIQSSADFLMADSTSAEVCTDAELILKATRRASQLTRQLVTFSRQDVVRPTSVDMTEQVRELGHMLKRLIRADIEMVVEVATEPAIVRMGTGHLEQVLVNMTLNARDAMPAGGKLVIKVERLASSEVPSTLGWPTDKGAVCLSVTDTGQGMSREMLNHAFEPFFTTKEQGRGTGLGLAVCYGIIRQNGGQITAVSTPNVGTAFRAYLPISHGLDVAAEERSIRVPPAGTEVILLVEDDEEVRAAACRVLERSGYYVVAANNGVEALELMVATDRPIDLVLADIIMPVMGGRELAEQVRKNYPGVKVLFMSGYAAPKISEPLVRKPFSADELAEMVRATLDA